MAIITVQEVNTSFVKKGKGGYHQAEVTYTDNGKNFTKKIMSFTNPAVFDTIKDAAQGDQFELAIKKEGDFYNWVSLAPVSKDGPKSPPDAQPKNSYTPRPNNTYETAEERKLKQLYIIRQSSIANAIEYLNVVDYKIDDINHVLSVAQQFVDFVYGNEDLASLDTED